MVSSNLSENKDNSKPLSPKMLETVNQYNITNIVKSAETTPGKTPTPDLENV
jgi:hypothetical protein